MEFRIVRILLFTVLLFNQNVRENKSILVLISSLIIKDIAISLIILTNIAKFPLNLLIVLMTIIFCIDLVYIVINKILSCFKISKIN